MFAQEILPNCVQVSAVLKEKAFYTCGNDQPGVGQAGWLQR